MSIFDFFFGRKQNENNSHYGVKLNRNAVRTRNLAMEPLESRDLLSVTTGLIDDSAYAELRAQYPDFNLPANQSKLNVITVDLDEGATALKLEDLKSAIETAGTTTQPDLILVKTTANTSKVKYTSNADEISISINASRYGSVTIIGWGEENFTLDANQQCRVMSITGTSTVVNLGRLSIAGGSSTSSASNTDFAGGVYINKGTLTITNSTISGNTAQNGGGGIYNDLGTLTVTNSVISGNTVTKYDGGGIDNGGILTVTNCVISGNTANCDGGGICNGSENSTVIVTSSIISGNTASHDGGGIYNVVGYGGTLTITNCTITENTASSNGGGISNVAEYSTVIITNSIISKNTASSSGGGIYNYIYDDDIAVLTITNCEISGNTAIYGGGIYNYVYGDTISLMVTNSTISGNTASSLGGGIYNVTSETLTVTNSIVSRNHGGNVNGLLSSNSSNNLIGGYYPGFVCPPQFDSDGKLTNIGTMDLHLRNDSIAIDKGDNTAVADIDTDIDGATRIFGKTVDIGAYEYQGNREDEPIPYSTVVNTHNDSFDLNDDEWSLREAIYYAPEYVTITFADNLKRTIVLTLGQLEIESPLVIVGDNRIVIDADQKSRVFYVSAEAKESPVVLNGLIIQNGKISNYGGGIFNCYSTLTITNSEISGNKVIGSDTYGAGIYNHLGTLTVTNSEISGNSASGTESCGGGICNYYGIFTVINSTITGNQASNSYSSGAGIFNRYGSLTVINSEISRNKAYYCGGGIHNFGSNSILSIINSTIFGNTAFNGGGIYNSTSVVPTNVFNSIIVCNTATNENDIYKSSSSIYGYNCLSSYTAWDDGNDNLVYDSSEQLFIDATNGDCHLIEGSQAIDKGNNAFAVDSQGVALTYDLDGSPRIVNGTVDIGAYESNIQNQLAIPEFTLTANESSVTVTISKVDNVSSYTVLYQINGSDSWTTITDVHETSVSFVGIAGMTYNVKVQANGTGDYTNSDYSASKSIKLKTQLTGMTLSTVSPLVGTTITATLAPPNATAEYQWYSGTEIITGATEPSFTVTESQIGQTINCVATGTGDYTDSISATTAEVPKLPLRTPNAPTFTAEGNIVTASWFGVEHASSYQFEYKLSTDSEWIVKTVSGVSTTFEYDPELLYIIRVKALGENNYVDSSYSSETTFINYAAIREKYSDFNLPESESDINIILVNLTAGDDLVDLKNAIAISGSTTKPDLILVKTSASANSITYTSSEDELSINIDSSQYGSVTITSWGEEKFTIDADQQSRVMTVSGSSTIVNLGNLTITGGNASNSSSGSGIYNSATLTVANCTITENTASSNGGGIYNKGGTLTVINCEISGNTAGYGGGGIGNNTSGTLIVTNSTISGNTAAGDSDTSSFGGGICNAGKTDVTNSTISGNIATYNGGGIYNQNGNLTVTNSTISENISYFKGGGFNNNGGTLTITNCTISGNITSHNGGGGIYCSNGVTTLYSTIVADNKPANSKDIYKSGGSVNGYNCLSSYTAWNNGSNNIVYDSNLPLFIDANNGDYRLTAGSQAIDKGNNQYAVDTDGHTLTIDLANIPRIQGESVDIGAYEFDMRTLLLVPEFTLATDSASIIVTITEDENATAYQIEYALNEDFSDSVIIDAQTGENVLNDIIKDQTYYIRVQAIGDDVYSDSEFSSARSIILNTVPPAAPVIEVTVNGSDSVMATVSVSDGAVGYRLQYSTDDTFAISTIADVDAGQNIIRGLLPDTVYYFRTYAYGVADLHSDFSNVESITISPTIITPLNAPSDLALSAENTTVTATWSTVDNASSYTVLYQIDGNDGWTTITDIQGLTTSFVGVAGAKYNVKVQANGTGNYSNSEFSESASITLAVPPTQLTGLTLSNYAPEVGATIIATLDQTDATADYQWYCGTTIIDKASASSFTVTESQIGQTITCVATGTGNYIGTVSATTAVVPALPLDTPTAPSLTAEDTLITATWSKVTNASSYTVEYQVDGSDGWFVIAGINGTTTSFIGIAGTTYNVRVQANGTGNYSDSSYSEVASITLPVPPTQITNFTLSTDSPTVGTVISTTLSPSDATVEYQWYCGDTAITGATESSFTVTEEQIGQTITCVAIGTGNYTGSVSGTTAVVPALPLDTPNVPALSIEDTTITATWSAVNNASNYTVEYQADGADGWFVINGINGTATSFIGVAGTTYNVKFKANGTGNYSDSDYSEVVSITLPIPPTQITGLTLSTTTPEVGSVITTTLLPSDATVDYQWYCGETSIIGAIESSFIVTEEQIGQTITCVATGINNYTGEVSATTTVVPAIAVEPPSIPELSLNGTTVNVSWSAVDDASGYTLEYQAVGSESISVITGISGSTSSFNGVAGATYNVRVKANGTGYYTDSEFSKSASIYIPIPLTGLTLSTKNPIVGTNITTSLTPSDATVTYQWYSGETIIDGIETSYFTVTEDQIGQTITCVVTANGNYTGVVSAITAVVPALPLDTPDKPTLTVEDTTISVSWLSVEHSSGYTVEYKFGSSDWSVLTTTVETTALLIGQPGIEYSFRVKANGTNIYADSEYSTADTISIADTLDAHNDFVKTTPNSPVVIDYRENDDATDWSAVTVQFGEASHGEYIVSEDGTISYTPENGFFGTDLISYVLVSPSGKLAPGAITINVDLPIATSVQKTSSSHSPSTEMAASVERLTDWDNCCIELWASDVNELNSGETTVTLEYNPAVYNVPYFSACSEGVALATSEGTVLPNGNVEIQLTVYVLEPLESQTDNLFLGTVVLKPTSEEEGGVDDVLTPEPVCTLNGTDLSTTVQSMPFDLIRNGIIDVNDFIAFATVFGLKSENMSSENPLYNHTVMSDFDANGIVDVNDFIAFATYFGISKKTAAKPIPQASAATDSEDCAEIQQTQNEVAVYEEQIQEPLPATSSVPVLIPENEVESSMTLLEAYSATLLDLYDNQNQSATPTALFAKAVDESLAFDDDSFDFLFDESDSDADDNSDVGLSVVLEELDWELI